MDYRRVASQSIKAVGGLENISHVTHCVTRLRFVLKDSTLASKDAITKIDGVLKLIEKDGQHQLVIGNKVDNVYEEALKIFNGQATLVEDVEEVKEVKEIKEKSIIEEAKNSKQVNESTSKLPGILIALFLILAVAGAAFYFLFL